MGIQSVIFGKRAVSGVKAPCTAFSINTRFSLTEHRDACRASGNRTYKSNMDIENQYITCVVHCFFVSLSWI